MYYVYRHIRLDTNTPFYVGKGKNRRAYHKAGRNVFWKRIAKKHGYEVEIIMENLQESQAFEKEREFVKLYKSLGYCEANITDGGDGLHGVRRSTEFKQNLSDRSKGNRWGGNRDITDEYREKALIGQPHRKEVLCVNNGKIYRSIAEAARKLGLSSGNISNVISGKYAHTKQYRFEKV